MARRFDSQKLVEISEEGKRYLRNVIYPEIPVLDEDIYIMAVTGDRYDSLALEFYNNVDYWWIIAISNTDSMDSLVISPGTQIRIPAYPEKYHVEFEKLNSIV